MLPFFPSLPNQIQSQTGSTPAFQQEMQFNPHQLPPSSSTHQQNPTGFNHPPPLPHGPNPRFPTPPMHTLNNQTTHFNTFHGSNAGVPNRSNPMPPPRFPNAPGFPPVNPQLGPHRPAQNMNRALAALQLLQQQSMPQFHGQQNHLQNNILAALMQPGGLFGAHNTRPNVNQIAALQMGQLCSQNPMLNGNQVLPFQCPQPQHLASAMQSLNTPPSTQPVGVGNPQMVPANSNSNFGNTTLSNEAMLCKNQDPRQFSAPTTTGQSAIPAATQKPQPLVSPFPMQSQQAWMNLQLNGHWQPQVNHVADTGNYISSVISDCSTSKNFTTKFHGYGVSSNTRFQKYQFPHAKNAKGNMGPFTKTGGRGQKKQRERNQLTKSTKQTQPEQRRAVPFRYTEKEILQWLEARKKNFPTRDNIQKKLARRQKFAGRGRRNQEGDEDAKLRCQQLKEVLAKQAELGVEVAVIPPRYLAEPKKQIGKQDGRLLNKHKSGGWYREKRHSKKPKIGDEASNIPVANAEKEPTLLQKLLSSDSRRDESRLLHVFRFMVLNSFFEQWPDKSLEFPLVMVEDMGHESKIAAAVALGVGQNVMDEETGNDEDVDEAGNGSSEDESGGEEDNVREQSEKGEEGERAE